MIYVKGNVRLNQIQLSKLLLVLFCYSSVYSYNLSPKPNAILRDPQLSTIMPKYESSYFGFTLNLRKLGIFIGAPRAQSNIDAQRHINETGAIYRCTYKANPQCSPYVFDDHNNVKIENSEYSYDSERRDFQWLGASMSGGSKDTDKLIVCAPRFTTPTPNDNDYFMHGRCYWINDTLTEKPTRVYQISPLRGRDDQIRGSKRNRYYYYMLAEQGLSAHVTPDNEQFLIGAPGIHTWKGSVIRVRKNVISSETRVSRRDVNSKTRIARQTKSQYEFNIPNPQHFNQEDNSYLGYSVSSGYFDSNNPDKLLYLASAPQADLQSGEAYIFDYTHKSSIVKHYVFRGVQFGEYFGYSVLAEDINGDGLTDVVVSAPQYNYANSFDNGAIYVFVNQGKLNFERMLITSPIRGKARFGTTLTKLGDINQDGFNDIGVSAPFAGDGSVFVYMGSARGLREQHSQRLDYPKTLKSHGEAMFGHGLSQGSDIDGNGVNDFAVGAPNAEVAFLYQSYPVVSIRATISTETRELKQEQKSFKANVCYRISTNSIGVKSQQLQMHVIIDPQVKRVQISSTDSGEMKFNVKATTETKCQAIDCNVRFSFADIFKPIELKLQYQLLNGVPDSELFCEDCAAVDPAEPKAYIEKLIFISGCTSQICVADLQISSQVSDSYILGSGSSISVSYNIINKGETAYLPQINITSSNLMPFAKIPSNCKLNDEDAVLLCDINSGQPMTKGTKDTITVTYDTSGISGENMTLTAKVFSTGKESSFNDNIARNNIKLIEFTDITAVGESKTGDVNLKQYSDVVDIVNFYKITSNGPSTINDVQIIFDIPVSYTIAGKILPIVDKIVLKAMYDSQNVKISEFVLKPSRNMSIGMYPFTTRGNKFIISRDSFGNTQTVGTLTKKQIAGIAGNKTFDLLAEKLKRNLPSNRTILFSCHDSNTTTCVQVALPLHKFKPNIPATVEVKYRVDVKDVNKILKNPWTFFVIAVDFNIQRLSDPLSKTFAVSKNIEYNLISKDQLEIPLWMIILGIIGGLLVLILIAYGMYRVGFFRRAKKEEMEKLVHQAKLAKDVANQDPQMDNDNE